MLHNNATTNDRSRKLRTRNYGSRNLNRTLNEHLDRIRLRDRYGNLHRLRNRLRDVLGNGVGNFDNWTRNRLFNWYTNGNHLSKWLNNFHGYRVLNRNSNLDRNRNWTLNRNGDWDRNLDGFHHLKRCRDWHWNLHGIRSVDRYFNRNLNRNVHGSWHRNGHTHSNLDGDIDVCRHRALHWHWDSNLNGVGNLDRKCLLDGDTFYHWDGKGLSHGDWNSRTWNRDFDRRTRDNRPGDGHRRSLNDNFFDNDNTCRLDPICRWDAICRWNTVNGYATIDRGSNNTTDSIHAAIDLCCSNSSD